MSFEFVVDQAEQAVYIILLICGPLLLIALVVGLAVSIFQATTQIQEQTLAFIPKIVAILLALVILGPFMLDRMVSYTYQIFSNLWKFVG
ncbi:MAG: flagellar biosynthesis protein FliQ [Bacilli bacterium]